MAALTSQQLIDGTIIMSAKIPAFPSLSLHAIKRTKLKNSADLCIEGKTFYWFQGVCVLVLWTFTFTHELLSMKAVEKAEGDFFTVRAAGAAGAAEAAGAEVHWYHVRFTHPLSGMGRCFHAVHQKNHCRLSWIMQCLRWKYSLGHFFFLPCSMNL